MKTIFVLVFLFNFFIIAQNEQFDKLELKDGRILVGKVAKISIDAVEFTDSETDLLYEYPKSNIRYILLPSGKVLIFDEDNNDKQKADISNETYNPNDQIRSLLYLNAGLSLPSSPDEFSDYWSSGYNLGVYFALKVSPTISVGPEISYSSFGFDDEKFLDDAGANGYNLNVSGGEISVLLAVIDIKINLSNRNFHPYFIGDLGYYNQEVNDITISAPGVGSQSVSGNSEDGFTYGVGIGFEIMVSPRMNLFFEVGIRATVVRRKIQLFYL